MESGSADEQGEQEQVTNDLLARVRELTELQRQLEGLEQVTARMQAAFSPTEGQAGAPATAAGGRPPREIPSTGHRSRGAILGLGRHRARAAEEPADREDEEVHPHVTCDGCHAGPTLRGRVWHCADCEDFDLCDQCYQYRDRLGHPRSHRFHPRPPQQRAEQRRGMPSQLLMQMLESAMLSEALRRSVEGDVVDEAARNEARGAEVFASLPRQTWTPAMACGDGSQGSECCLCLEEYKTGDNVVVLPCSHFFHEDCVQPWFAKSLACPLCQQEASSASEGAAAAP